MATPIATKETVYAACDALAKEGIKPSILTLREKIGGGSYSTVSRHLEAWQAEQAVNPALSIELPPAAETAALDMAKTIWALAERDITAKTAAIREAAENKVAMISDDFDIAKKEIERLDGLLEESQAKVEAAQKVITAKDAELNELRVQASRADDLEKRLVAAEAALAASRAESEARAIEASRSVGVIESLREQIAGLTNTILQMSQKGSGV